ncbi:Lar family restriction alleviation protein [Citrobacter freundii]|nr:Lar family restriction alleviation protein [Citrobacter freundii]ELT9543356.1 Lar family restriction alleviation protein [Citrobacter freundii]
MTTNNHPANGPVSLNRLHQISEILSKAAAQSDGGNLGYAMADAVKVIDGVLESTAREQVRREHAAWSQVTFGNVGPVGPLKHLSKEALEAAAEPGYLSEWADMQFLLWDAQRHAGISDEQVTLAMVEKLAVNKQREWPEPKDGEPRLHIKELPAPVAINGLLPCPFCGGKAQQLTIEQDNDPHFGGDVITCTECGASSHVEFGFKENLKSAWNSRAAMLQAGNSPVTPDGSEDTKRLDWLDAQNKRLNEYYGTSYGWKFDANFQRNAMMLNDSNYPVMTVRQAIDEAIAEAPKQENV